MDFWRGALLASLILSSIMVYPFSSSLAATTNSPPVLEPIGNLDEAIQQTITEINGMVSAGKFNEGQATSLIQKLDAATKKIESLQSSAADKILRAFINQVDAFVKSGQLTYDDGQILIEDIQIILYTM